MFFFQSSREKEGGNYCMEKNGLGIDGSTEEPLETGGRGREHKTSVDIDLGCGNPCDIKITSVFVGLDIF